MTKIIQIGNTVAAIALCFSCIGLQSCQEKGEDGFSVLSLDDFKEVAIDEPQMWDGAPEDQFVGAVYSQGDQYAMLMPMDSCKLHFYDTDLNSLYSRVVEGQGPGDFVNPNYCGQWRKDANGNILTGVFDSAPQIIKEVSPEFNGGREIAALPVKFDLSPLFAVSSPDNKLLYGVSSYFFCQFGRGVMFRYDIANDSLQTAKPTFEVEDEKAATDLMQKATAISQDCSLIVNAYLYEPVLEFWDGNLRLVKSMKLKDVEMVGAEFNNETAPCYFYGTQVTDDYVYVLYYARQFNHPGTSYLLAFDHSGKPAFKINVGNTFFVAVNEKSHTILLLRTNEEDEPVVYIARLPELPE